MLGIWKGLLIVTFIMCLSDGSKWDLNSVAENFQDNLNQLFLMLILPFLCRGVSPRKISFNSFSGPWQMTDHTHGLANADGESALLMQLVDLRSPDLSLSVFQKGQFLCLHIHYLEVPVLSMLRMALFAQSPHNISTTQKTQRSKWSFI